MKILRRGLLILLIAMVLILGIGFFLPSKLFVEKEIIIKSPVNQVFAQINELRNWEKWSPWFLSDSTVQINYSEKTVGNGSSFTYQCQKYGSGKVTIIGSYPDDSIVFEMDFVDRGKALGKFLFIDVDTAVVVKWNMESKLGYNPVSRWFSLIMKNAVGSDFSNGLSNLSALMQQLSFAHYQIGEVTVPSRVFISIRDTCSTSGISNTLGEIYSQLMQYVIKQRLTSTGAPICLYHSYNDSVIILEPAIPVDRLTENDGKINVQQVPEMNAVKAVFFGPYEKTVEAWNAIESYIRQKNLKPTASPWEEYITDPLIEKDTSKWQTNIYYPAK